MEDPEVGSTRGDKKGRVGPHPGVQSSFHRCIVVDLVGVIVCIGVGHGMTGGEVVLPDLEARVVEQIHEGAMGYCGVIGLQVIVD